MEPTRTIVAVAQALLLAACSTGSDSSDAAPWSKSLELGDGSVMASPSRSGEIAIAGTISGPGQVSDRSVDFGMDQASFFTSFDRQGDVRWLVRGSNLDRTAVKGFAADATGGLVAVGWFIETVDFGRGEVTAIGVDTFVDRLDSSGNVVWVRHFSADDGGPAGAGNSNPAAVVVGADGSVVFAGNFTGTIGFGGRALDAAQQGAYVTKLDREGRHVWSRSLGAAPTYVERLAIDSEGDLILTGARMASSPDDPTSNPDEPEDGARFVMKLGSDGSDRWETRLGASLLPDLDAMTVDASGGVIIAGQSQSDVELGGLHLDARPGAVTPFAAQLSSKGEALWIRELDISGFGRPLGAAVDSSGRAYVAGFEVVGAGSSVGFLYRLGEQGKIAQRWDFGDGEAVVSDVQPLGSDLLLTGSFAGRIDIGGTNLSAGEDGLFLARFRP